MQILTSTAVFQTDQVRCFDAAGGLIPCSGSGQDGAARCGVKWPEPRFVEKEGTVQDRLTGLMWPKNASLDDFPMMWEEAMEQIEAMNRANALGYRDWRLPNRKELFSLVSHLNVNPSLPSNHPFINVFTGYYWTSTTCSRLPRQAWYVHLGGGRVFKGMKHGSYMVWPVRGGAGGLIQLPRSGQSLCFDQTGQPIFCTGIGQDGSFKKGAPWPNPRFTRDGGFIMDELTGLMWLKDADSPQRPVNWPNALAAIREMNAQSVYGRTDWRLPNIRELESLLDMSAHSPALPARHPFSNVREYYWSSTTSTYDPAYAWVVYITDGALGVGYKGKADFFVWPVCGGQWC